MIHAAKDSSESQQLEESCNSAEPIENSTRLADASETPEEEVKVETPLNGKSKYILVNYVLQIFFWHNTNKKVMVFISSVK